MMGFTNKGIMGMQSTGFSVGLPLAEAFERAMAFWQKEKAEIGPVTEPGDGSEKKFTASFKFMEVRFAYTMTFRQGEAKVTNILAGVQLTNARSMGWNAAIKTLEKLSKALGVKQHLEWGEDNSLPSATKKCPVCGAKMPGDAITCPECGEPLG